MLKIIQKVPLNARETPARTAAANTVQRRCYMKTITNIVLVWLMVAESLLALDTKASFNTGDTGPAGGIIFFANGQCMEAAGTEFMATWSDAVKRSEWLILNGISGWCLPTKEELDAMYRQLYKQGLGAFSTHRPYWSSSENGNYNAWAQRFGDGDQDSYGKGNEYLVRVVRALDEIIHKINSSDTANSAWRIGATGPAGGSIFYLYNQRMEAAPASTEFQANWNNAVRRCESLNVNGISGWRLPTKEELNAMYHQLYKKGHGGFFSKHYWSSSDFNQYYFSDYVSTQNFDDGRQGGNSKNSERSVRAVRALDDTETSTSATEIQSSDNTETTSPAYVKANTMRFLIWGGAVFLWPLGKSPGDVETHSSGMSGSFYSPTYTYTYTVSEDTYAATGALFQGGIEFAPVKWLYFEANGYIGHIWSNWETYKSIGGFDFGGGLSLFLNHVNFELGGGISFVSRTDPVLFPYFSDSDKAIAPYLSAKIDLGNGRWYFRIAYQWRMFDTLQIMQSVPPGTYNGQAPDRKDLVEWIAKEDAVVHSIFLGAAVYFVGKPKSVKPYQTEKISPSGNNFLFPLEGVTLGKTTVKELAQRGKRSTHIDNSTGQPYLYYTINGINFWYDDKTGLSDHLSLYHRDNMPKEWQSAGLSWEKSYDEWLAWAIKSGMDIKVVESPTTKRRDNINGGKPSFSARVEIIFTSKSNIPYRMTLNFDYSSGTTSRDKNTLYSISVNVRKRRQ
jgi:hypothetical protein